MIFSGKYYLYIIYQQLICNLLLEYVEMSSNNPANFFDL